MIVIVYPQFYGVQGIARYVQSFLANLPVGHPPVLLLTGDEEARPVDFPGVEIRQVELRASRLALLRWGYSVRKILREMHSRGELTLVNYHWPPLIPGLFLPKDVPLVLTAHTTYLGMAGQFYDKSYYRSQWGSLSVAIKKWMERRILAHTDRIISLTDQGVQELRRYGYSGPISVIPNGADLSKFVAVPGTPKEFDVMFSGRVETRKGSRSVGEVCRALIRRRPSAKVVVVGYGDDDEFLKEDLAGLSANVLLTGKVPFQEMQSYYNRAKVYAATSYYEGLPGTCLEAMAMGLPAVVWDFDFYKGLVVPVETGFVVTPNDYDAMATKLELLMDAEDLRARMGSQARELIRSAYDWKELAPRVLEAMLPAAAKATEA